MDRVCLKSVLNIKNKTKRLRATYFENSLTMDSKAIVQNLKSKFAKKRS